LQLAPLFDLSLLFFSPRQWLVVFPAAIALIAVSFQNLRPFSFQIPLQPFFFPAPV
jgi:hypothetical protein